MNPRDCIMHGPAPHRELEVKLELAPASLAELKKSPLLRTVKMAPKRQAEVSVYFDTNKHKLRKNGVMLRVRRVGSRYVQTIKANGNLAPFDRDEWETEIASEQPDLSLVKGTALEPLMTKKSQRQLRPLFETRVQRTAYPVVDGAYAIALTVDRGTINTGTRTLPLCDIELELKRGTAAKLFEVARKLTGALPARLAMKSKSERGYEIIDGEWALPAKASSIDLPAQLSARDAFTMIGLACLKQIIDNEAAFMRGDPEGVHQMRVGLRRLRAGMSLFGILLRDPQTTAIKAQLKWLAGELSEARELEVLVTRVVAPIRKRSRRWRGMPSLSHEIEERREAALKRARHAVHSSRFRALTLDVAAWLQVGQWTNPQDDLVRDQGNLPISDFATEQLARRLRKIRKKGKALDRLDASSRHKLRIQAKKLRYAVEFFASLFASKRAVRRRKQFLSALERLQDGLGDLNDIAVHEKRIAAMGSRRQPSRAFAAGLLTGREDARIEAAMSVATDAYADLVGMKSFWR
jgi:inorganic triphosphatase YgiF